MFNQFKPYKDVDPTIIDPQFTGVFEKTFMAALNGESVQLTQAEAENYSMAVEAGVEEARKTNGLAVRPKVVISNPVSTVGFERQRTTADLRMYNPKYPARQMADLPVPGHIQYMSRAKKFMAGMVISTVGIVGSVAYEAYDGSSSDAHSTVMPGKAAIQKRAVPDIVYPTLDNVENQCYDSALAKIPGEVRHKDGTVELTRDAAMFKMGQAEAQVIIDPGVTVDSIAVCGAEASLTVHGSAGEAYVIGAEARLDVRDGKVGHAGVTGQDCIIVGPRSTHIGDIDPASEC